MVAVPSVLVAEVEPLQVSTFTGSRMYSTEGSSVVVLDVPSL
jgi:hypothetical protein